MRQWLTRTLVGGGVLASVGALALLALLAVRVFAIRGPTPGVEMRSTPGVVLAIHDVARLEATQFHIEKVIEVTESQSRLWGLVRAKDALLLVAVGDVIAGVDLAKVSDTDVRIESEGQTIHLRLPAPEVFTSTLDERATHVYTRSTDVLASRNEQLEGAARRAAEDQMRQAAIAEGILDRAKTSADRTMRALLRSMGFQRVDLDWADRG